MEMNFPISTLAVTEKKGKFVSILFITFLHYFTNCCDTVLDMQLHKYICWKCKWRMVIWDVLP